MQQRKGYEGPDQPALADLDLCTRCGLCEQACPTYRMDHFEPDSPRGRIFLMKQVAEASADVNEHLAKHLYTCLGCRACESVCPSGVPFGRLLEYGRFQVEQRGEIIPARRGWRRFRDIAFKRVLAEPWLFRAVMFPAVVLQRVPGLLPLVQSLPMPKRLKQLLLMIPQRTAKQPAFRSRRHIIPAQGKRKARVGLFVGCVMGSLFEHVHAATARVASRSGCEVVVVPNQWCCGALNVHAGERTNAAAMARRNIEAFGGEILDAILVNSAGCGAVMKEYGELLKDDARFAQRAQEFASKVKDVTEYFAGIELRPGLHALAERVTYQDACHLAHGQRIREQPRALLKQIPGLEFRELPHADRCCGAAGVYSLTHPQMAGRILDEKLDEIAQSGAQTVAIANPGCAMQLQSGLLQRGMSVRVCHVVELLDRSCGSP